jgi:hypothetical protein
MAILLPAAQSRKTGKPQVGSLPGQRIEGCAKANGVVFPMIATPDEPKSAPGNSVFHVEARRVVPATVHAALFGVLPIKPIIDRQCRHGSRNNDQAHDNKRNRPTTAKAGLIAKFVSITASDKEGGLPTLPACNLQPAA